MAERIDAAKAAQLVTLADQQADQAYWDWDIISGRTDGLALLRQEGWMAFARAVTESLPLGGSELANNIAEVSNQASRQREVVSRYTENLAGRSIQFKEFSLIEAQRAGLMVAAGEINRSAVAMWIDHKAIPSTGLNIGDK